MLARLRLAALPIVAALAVGPAIAAAPQTGRDPNVGTETQERIAEGQTDDFNWEILGLLGLFGLAGLRRRPDYSDPV
jgi:hypothetical protein